MVQTGRKYDLEERTALFGESIIKLCRGIKQDNVVSPIISQLIRSATSVGANYMEANGASSKRDFVNKIFICKKELQETKHWLRMIDSAQSGAVSLGLEPIKKECQELIFIFTKIASSSRSNE
ncbi:MAG: four helix bundle protein [Candidatus Zambryskibacteria bacterium RIFCSPHIGHO2_01_FULL_46_30]|uniref:Four helix bundle protein n=1 Tax=Candidatus Zambryskibacteria bacterium RIFCSPHIGHO2_01_FULL_46_30 TaxID=1802739 RepID=A0A1G2T0P1_9BACT|nr:MAG: four helix bundle protein [Candidatus Zambryskibacteria bacterium RIFCSPHIGHO2_01_FULL_46_30]OHB05366.1 MAG: four helix bundle protein [Candidatus Zambryskibacteria bacterium RIFCSPLOWO2_01_FULL_47_33]